MYNTIKKLSLSFIFLNVFMFQSLMADMMFYYNAAILPSIIASQQKELIANHDNVVSPDLVTTTVNVLENDIIPSGSNITILLQEMWSEDYNDVVLQDEGYWQVVGDTVTFTPNQDLFSSGTIQINYKIIDQNGNESINWINIEFPVFVQANTDQVTSETIEPVNIPVLANDTNTSPVTNVLFETYDYNAGQTVYVDRLETFDGNWSVESNLSVTFTPNASYGGGNPWIIYQIVDQYGHTSKNDIEIQYPLFVYAENDYIQPTAIEQTIINVLDNDIVIGGSALSISLEIYNYNTGQVEYVDNVNNPEGTWTVDGSTVVFIPDANFAGGGVGISYQIMDDQGRVAQNYIYIEFPVYVQANYDYKLASAVEAVTVDVLVNDMVGDGVIPTVLLQTYVNNEYVDRIEQYDGVWSVEANQSVTFTPNENFTSRYVNMTYQLSDNNGYTSQAGINIEYPVEIYAEYDYVQPTVIQPVTVDILENDTNTSAVTLKFEVNQGNGMVYLDSVEAFDGNWSIESDQSVTFTPNANFGGGHVFMQYQITDQEGRMAASSITIEYPVMVYAQWDQIQTDLIEPIMVDVLANDTNMSAVTIELVNQNYNTGSEDIGTTIVTHQGEWSVNGDEVLFEPNVDFGGGSIYMQYQITDPDGRMSRTTIEIIYPITATAVCTVPTLSTVEDVYTTLILNLSFDDNNGRRNFEAELDIDNYTIEPALYGSSTPETGDNPMYMVWYEEASYVVPSGDTFINVEMDSTQIELNSTNGTWFYEGQNSGNDRNYKYVGTEGENGTYTVESDGSNTLSIGGDDIFSFKVVQEISDTDIYTILNDVGITLDLDPEDTAQLHLSKELMDDYDWWGAADGNSYASLNDFIASNEYNSSVTQFYNTILHSQTWQKGIIFAEGSAGQSSGTLIEIDKQTNTILVDDAGPWNIENITDNDGNNYDIIVIEPILCGYQKRIFRLEGSTILHGQREEAGIIGAELGYSSTLKDKLFNYFISVAPLDIDPSNPTSPEMTESMLSGKVFYTVNDRGDGTKDFEKITVESPSSVSLREILVDTEGTIFAENTGTVGYRLEDGRIEVENDQGSKVWLNADPGMGDWSVTTADWSYMSQKTWLLEEPIGFPQ